MRDCLICGGRFYEQESLFIDKGDSPDYGPICLNCLAVFIDSIATNPEIRTELNARLQLSTLVGYVDK